RARPASRAEHDALSPEEKGGAKDSIWGNCASSPENAKILRKAIYGNSAASLMYMPIYQLNQWVTIVVDPFGRPGDYCDRMLSHAFAEYIEGQGTNDRHTAG